jgi:ABC-type sugar transport system substrate-binding protein
MAKAPHPVEAYEADIIANAASWSAFQFRGVGDRQKAECATREEAQAAARQMIASHPKAVMIYAISAAGRQALAETIRP